MNFDGLITAVDELENLKLMFSKEPAIAYIAYIRFAEMSVLQMAEYVVKELKRDKTKFKEDTPIKTSYSIKSTKHTRCS